ncbi:MAG: hypothetical protein U0Z53_05260 [Blastocatellia bacterium]
MKKSKKSAAESARPRRSRKRAAAAEYPNADQTLQAAAADRPQLPVAKRETQPRRIRVSVRDNQVVVDNPVMVLNRTQREEVVWICDAGRLEVRFNPGNTPFYCHSYRASLNGGCYSGIPLSRRAQSQPYDYTLMVTTPGEDGRFLISPTLYIYVQEQQSLIQE